MAHAAMAPGVRKDASGPTGHLIRVMPIIQTQIVVGSDAVEVMEDTPAEAAAPAVVVEALVDLGGWQQLSWSTPSWEVSISSAP